MAFIVIRYDISLHIELFTRIQHDEFTCFPIITRNGNSVAHFFQVAGSGTFGSHFFRVVLRTTDIACEITCQYDVSTIYCADIDISDRNRASAFRTLHRNIDYRHKILEMQVNRSTLRGFRFFLAGKSIHICIIHIRHTEIGFRTIKFTFPPRSRHLGYRNICCYHSCLIFLVRAFDSTCRIKGIEAVLILLTPLQAYITKPLYRSREIRITLLRLNQIVDQMTFRLRSLQTEYGDLVPVRVPIYRHTCLCTVTIYGSRRWIAFERRRVIRQRCTENYFVAFLYRIRYNFIIVINNII